MTRKLRLDPSLTADVRCRCGASVTVGETEDGEQVVLHMLPTCLDFDQRDPLEFVVWLRKLAERRARG